MSEIGLLTQIAEALRLTKPIPKGAKKKRDSNIWQRHPEDWYVEPEWVAAGFFGVAVRDDLIPAGASIVDPCAGCGRIVKAARIAGFHAIGLDIAPNERKLMGLQDFNVFDLNADFMSSSWPQYVFNADHFVGNAPFKWCEGGEAFKAEKLKLGEGFVGLALARAQKTVSLILPATWHTSYKRLPWLRQTGLKYIYHITPRPSMPPGPALDHLLRNGGKEGNGEVDFAFYHWERGYSGKPMVSYIEKPRITRNGGK